jgi:dephospho-CoA kinase
MTLGVTGTNGAGKGAIVEYLVQKGFKHYSVREEIIRELERSGLPIDRPHMGEVGNALREKNGPGYFCNLFITEAKEKAIKDIVIESIRSPGEVHALKELGGILLAVDAERKIRYERVVLRGSATDKIDFDTWVAQEEKEWGNTAITDMDIPGVMRMADYTLTNNGSVEELNAQVDSVLEKVRK